MKKIFSIFLCAAFVFALSANLFAEGTWYTNDQFGDDAVIDFRPSNNVSVYYEADATEDNSTSFQEYIVGTKHTGGDTVYGSISADSNIYKDQKDTYRGKDGENSDVDFPEFPDAGESDVDWSGWDKM